MPLDPTQYSGRHVKPEYPARVALVAYERRDGGWDVFAFEPAGVCPPDWERLRVDREHLHLATIENASALDEAAAMIDARLGPDYDLVPAYREPAPGTRTQVQRRLHWLHKAGATGYAIRNDADGHAVLWTRRKDVPAIAHLDGTGAQR